MKRHFPAACVALLLVLAPASVSADTFASGSLIIPMDTDYQDDGMLKAYGLVYHLLLDGITINWCIKPGKSVGDPDFTATAEDYETKTAVGSHAYRGGPFVIDAADAATAKTRVDTWQTNHTTTVHEATAQFTCDVSRRLVNAPTIAMVADGNQKIARGYMQAAGIPDSTMDYTWPDSSPDMLDPTELAGPTTTDHADGDLFDADGEPVYCQLMSMHWDIKEANNNPEVVAEVREYLNYPTHFFAECQAVNAFENNTFGKFLTPNGFVIGNAPDAVDIFHADVPFVQIDGGWESVGGSEPAYSLPTGDSYKASDITMITEQGTPEGVNDVWMTGFLDGVCPPELEFCTSQNFGKISYLGGHEYDTNLPMSSNPKTQGTRMFLNSLFEAPCATEGGKPIIALNKSGDALSTTDTTTWTIFYENTGVSMANDVQVRDPLPAGATFVSATQGGQLVGGEVVWDLGTVVSGEAGILEVTVQLASPGDYDNTAVADFKAGLNDRQATSNTFTTTYCVPDDDATICQDAGAECGTLDVSDNCGQTRSVDCGVGACGTNAMCDSTNTCVCSSGYSGDGFTCADVDECSDGTDTCSDDATCTNTDGSFDCTCKSGFTGDGFVCNDIDECADGTASCDTNATCNNLSGTFECVCNSGYTGDGTTCTDIDECTEGTANCDTNATCNNLSGSFECVCDSGYEGDGSTCTDVDECAEGTDACDTNAICMNQAGSYDCVCDDGYSGDGMTCADVDECADGTHDCDPVATCSNTPGGFTCACPPGYEGDGTTCTEIACGCEDDEICVGDECYATCSNDDDCPDAAEACYGGRCASDACVGVSCDDDQTCTGGSCYSPCATNDDCADGHCYDGRCAQTACAGVICSSSQICRGGTCVDACSDDSDCADGEQCFESGCAADACAGVTCPEGEECVDGGCFSTCQEDSDCPGDFQRCYDGRCADGPCESVVCATGEVCDEGGCFAACGGDEDCSTGSCVDGKCKEGPCDSVDCPAGESCVDGTCVGECTSNDDCGEGARCVDGLCEPPESGSSASSGTQTEGCGCGSTNGSASHLWLVLVALLVARRWRPRVPARR